MGGIGGTGVDAELVDRVLIPLPDSGVALPAAVKRGDSVMELLVEKPVRVDFALA